MAKDQVLFDAIVNSISKGTYTNEYIDADGINKSDLIALMAALKSQPKVAAIIKHLRIAADTIYIPHYKLFETRFTTSKIKKQLADPQTITRFPDLRILPNLESFMMKGTGVTRVPSVYLSNCTKLETVEFEDTIIEMLPSALFSECPDLSEFSITSSQLTYISSVLFAKSTKLLLVEIVDSKISSVPKDLFSNCPKLVKVDLNGNDRLKSIPKEIFAKCPDLDEFIHDLCGKDGGILPMNYFLGRESEGSTSAPSSSEEDAPKTEQRRTSRSASILNLFASRLTALESTQKGMQEEITQAKREAAEAKLALARAKEDKRAELDRPRLSTSSTIIERAVEQAVAAASKQHDAYIAAVREFCTSTLANARQTQTLSADQEYALQKQLERALSTANQAKEIALNSRLIAQDAMQAMSQSKEVIADTRARLSLTLAEQAKINQTVAARMSAAEASISVLGATIAKCCQYEIICEALRNGKEFNALSFFEQFVAKMQNLQLVHSIVASQRFALSFGIVGAVGNCFVSAAGEVPVLGTVAAIASEVGKGVAESFIAADSAQVVSSMPTIDEAKKIAIIMAGKILQTLGPIFSDLKCTPKQVDEAVIICVAIAEAYMKKQSVRDKVSLEALADAVTTGYEAKIAKKSEKKRKLWLNAILIRNIKEFDTILSNPSIQALPASASKQAELGREVASRAVSQRKKAVVKL